jgi:hypothetical protein
LKLWKINGKTKPSAAVNEHHTEPGEYDRPAVAEAFDTVAVVSVYETDLQH